MPASSSLFSLQTLLLLASIVTVVAAVLLWWLTSRRRSSAPAVDVDELSATVPVEETAPPRVPAATPRLVAPLVAQPAIQPASCSQHRPSHRGAPSREVGYAELSRSYAALGRGDAAARAQWAADLRLLAPLMTALSEDAAGLPDRLGHLEGSSPRHCVDQARGEVASLMSGTGLEWPAAPMLPALDHLPELPGPSTGGASAPTPPEELQRRAVELMELAALVVRQDPEGARRQARAADLAALDAVLLESARRFGDTSLVSVELRRNLAAAALHEHDQAPGRLPLAGEVRRTRAVLRTVVEPHEASRLEESLAPEPLT